MLGLASNEYHRFFRMIIVGIFLRRSSKCCTKYRMWRNRVGVYFERK